jgi:hypothetical protein
VKAGIERRFDDGDEAPLVEWVRPTEVWLDTQELARNGHDLSEVSRFVAGLTQSQTQKPGVPIEPGHANDRVFQAVFPSAMLASRPCLEQAS